MSKDLDYYEIQSSFNPKFGAVIYPYDSSDLRNNADGYYFFRLSDKKTLTMGELHYLAGQIVVEELLRECRKLHGGEVYG